MQYPRTAPTVPPYNRDATHWYFMELEVETGRRFNAWGSLHLRRGCTMPEAYQFAYQCAIENEPEAQGAIVTDFKLTDYMVHRQGLWARLVSWVRPRPAAPQSPRPGLLWGVYLDGELVTLRPDYEVARKEMLLGFAGMNEYDAEAIQENFSADLANGDWVLTRLDNRLRYPGFFLRQVPVVWASGE